MDKLKLRFLIAGCSPEEPEKSLARALHPSNGLIDLNAQSLDELSAFLQEFKNAALS